MDSALFKSGGQITQEKFDWKKRFSGRKEFSQRNVGGAVEMTSIPCFLCGSDLPIRTDKNKKRYFICDHCGVQAFVRKSEGISRLEDLLKSLRTREFEFAKH